MNIISNSALYRYFFKMVAGKAVRAVGLKLSALDSYLGFGHEFFKLNKLTL